MRPGPHCCVKLHEETLEPNRNTQEKHTDFGDISFKPNSSYETHSLAQGINDEICICPKASYSYFKL